MLSAFANCFKIPELRQRIIFTLCVVVVVRIGAAIPVPGINAHILALFFTQMLSKQENTVVGLFNLFSGGALEKLRRLHPRHHSVHHAPASCCS